MPVAHLYPRPPYDFSLSAAIFAGGDPQIRTYEHDIFCQALDIGGIPVWWKFFRKDRLTGQNCISLCARIPLFQRAG